MAVLAGLIFALLALALAGFQLGLAMGRPWGHLTLGGRYLGKLPVFLRIAALAYVVLWIGVAGLVLVHVGVIGEGFTGIGASARIGPVFLLCVVTMVLNLITPSRQERRLWGPVSIAMTAALGVVIVSG
mgnify:CR=1 FL=1